MLSIVTPVYNEFLGLQKFVSTLKEVLDSYKEPFEIILVVDPSTDGTENLVLKLHEEDSRIKALFMTRKFGQPICTFAGLEYAKGQAVIVMDSDFQDPPEVIPEMLERWKNGSLIVLGKRKSRTGEPALKRFLADWGYRFLNRYSTVPIPRNTGDFRLLDAKVVQDILRFKEANVFLRGIVALVGYTPDIVEFERPARKIGTTKYNKWTGSLKIAFDGILGFSNALLKLSTFLGVILSFLSFILGIAYALMKIFGHNFPIGNPTIVVLLLLLSGINLLALGVIGSYVGRIFDEVKMRPRFIVRQHVGLDPSH